ncbi:unnamed protein product [Gordionus sp. m RMFG-2023]|uniref:uncharacterized protein LOC135924530 n=1 Tax=Gordionus sp. m RMFG-2023 TaxID=3053472 RepID=UPI0030DFC63D
MKFENLNIKLDYINDKISKLDIIKLANKIIIVAATYDQKINKVLFYDATKSDDNDHSLNLISKFDIAGDPTCIIRHLDSIFISTSKGNLYIFFINKFCEISFSKYFDFGKNDSLINNGFHNDSCTALTVDTINDNLIISFIDGTLKILDLQTDKIIHTISNFHNTYLSTLKFIPPNSLLCGDLCGTVKLVDLKTILTKLYHKSFYSQNIDGGISALDVHPFNSNLVVCGDDQGLLTFWDLRKQAFPVQNSFNKHKSYVSGIKFHPNFPNKSLFSCSHDSKLLAWYNEQNTSDMFSSANDLDIQTIDLLEDSNSCSINGMALESDILVACTDNQGIFRIYLENFISMT